MLGRAQDPKKPAKALTATMPQTMQRFRREAYWGAAMMVALLVATLAAQSDVGAGRMAHILVSLNAPSDGNRPFDAEAAARELTQDVRTLQQDRDRLAGRLAAIERDMDDLTGSIKQQTDAAKSAQAGSQANSQAAEAWPIDAPPMPMTSADVAAMVKSATPVPAQPAATTAALPSDAAGSHPPAYGADIGNAPSMKALHAHWAALRTAHPQVFDGLHPVVALRHNAHANRTDLHLVVGPYASADAAAQFCNLLGTFHLRCQPTMFDDHHLALQ